MCAIIINIMNKIRLLTNIDLTKKNQKIILKKNNDVITGHLEIFPEELILTLSII